ncbi:MAG: tyrosine-type recombinase/integrase [Acidobacteriaceae bacterium]
MLRSLLPKSHNKFLCLPLLGPITDGFDDWLIANSYAAGSRKHIIRMLPHLDADLRRRRVRDVSDLTHVLLHACWRRFIKIYPTKAGSVRSLERYLVTTSVIATHGTETARRSVSAVLSNEYGNHLRKVRGFADSTICHHRYTAGCFLDHLKVKKVPVSSIQPEDIETYIKQMGKRLSRASLQHEIAAVRGFLRFLSTEGKIRPGLDRQIDTPRLYRLEQLPRAVPWDMVTELLRSIDTKSAMGIRDYAMFLLIATYGLRASEVVGLSVDDILWRQGILRIHQRKTSSPLELPLTNEVMAAVVKHLKRTPPPAPYRRVFLRMRAPLGVLKPTAVTEAFQAMVRKSGLAIPYQGPHCLRHAYALHLLKKGTRLKTIGDILGHRTAESTSMYLRLAVSDLREVALAVPGKQYGRKEGN